MSSLASPPSTDRRKDIFGLLGVGFYILFTLLPDSSSLVVSWPWVLIGQVALLLPWLWLLREGWSQKHLNGLGYGLDYGIALALVGLVGSMVLAPFPQQARWYSWAALGAIAAFYTLNAWCRSPARRHQLLVLQGSLSLAFMVVSLGLWSSQTFFPEMARLASLRAAGLSVFYDFSVLELRNWAPIGHQNYVAGYLVLSLPLLLALSVSAQPRWRWLWGGGILLGLVDLYTTSSRGGWLGVAAAVLTGGLLLLGHLPMRTATTLRFRWMVGLGSVAALMGIVLANNRLRSLFTLSTLDSAGGETAFRLITNVTGWAMGLEHPVFGVGLGGVPLLYQAYRPAWAGREAELVYQLHSTPAQIWAELGGVGIALMLGLLGWLGYWGVRLGRRLGEARSQALSSKALSSKDSSSKELQPPALERDYLLSVSLSAGLVGYGIVSLTDYQLDIVGISGTLILYGVCLLSLLRDYIPADEIRQFPKRLKVAWICWGLCGLLLVVGVWMTPILRAWQLSSLGFAALSQKQLEPFTTYLEQAHQLAPWEPYYSYQLGWNLANAQNENSQGKDAQTSQARLSQSQDFFQRNTQASPYQEAGTSSLGWLQFFNRQFAEATTSFLKSTQLVPAKRGAFHSLGLSLLAQNKVDWGVQALALEIVRDPIWLTSPLWRSTQYQGIYPQVLREVEQIYLQLLQNRSEQDPLTPYLRQCLGGLYWWQGKHAEADGQWRKHGTPLGGDVLAIARSNNRNNPVTPGAPILQAWLEPQQRSQWLEKAVLEASQALPDSKLVEALTASMNQAKSLDQWIQQLAPSRQYPRERAGFGVLSRHIDGPAPTDFFPVVENIAMTQFFAALLPSPSYSPDLDNGLQPFRKRLWKSIAPTQHKP